MDYVFHIITKLNIFNSLEAYVEICSMVVTYVNRYARLEAVIMNINISSEMRPGPTVIKLETILKDFAIQFSLK